VRKQAAQRGLPRHLDESTLETPSLALADAARETLYMGDMVETMLRNVITALMTNDPIPWRIAARRPPGRNKVARFPRRRFDATQKRGTAARHSGFVFRAMGVRDTPVCSDLDWARIDEPTRR
jgi:hypothetical protein